MSFNVMVADRPSSTPLVVTVTALAALLSWASRTVPQSGLIEVMAGAMLLNAYSWLSVTVVEFPAASLVVTLATTISSISLASLLPGTIIA